MPVHAKMMSLLANIFIESKKDWVSSEAQWAFDMSDSYESCVCVCSVVQMCHTFDLHIISILKGRRTNIYTEVAKPKTLVRSPSIGQANTQAHMNWINMFSFDDTTLFRNSFHLGLLTTKRQLDCNQYAAKRRNSKWYVKAAIKHLHLRNEPMLYFGINAIVMLNKSSSR